ncbi:hypothetical protein L9F63_006729 [Diploptera punctata]|uniref:Methyltransferase-like 26 n=1 Tax=Diploptera punctata TaxID=6984 RepID=A0AAD8E4K8_DIPPU|nr:hypothetical protein L9F63_006729 [Diploptera punctata]
MKAHRSTSSHRYKKQVNTAADRNKKPILEVIKKYISPYVERLSKECRSLYCLEISSGTGQHVAYFAPHFPSVIWQPSEVDKSSFSSISAYIEDSAVSNIQQPICIDICEDYTKWEGGKIGKQSVDFMVNINLIHISPYKCTEGLFRNAGQVLKSGGILFTYGPYAFHGKISPESNVRFDSMLRYENPEWGLRDIDQLTTLAMESSLRLADIVALPANNHILVWNKD